MALPGQLRRFLPTVLVLTMGAMLSVLAFVGTRRMEERAFRSDFERSSEIRSSALRREIDSNLAALAMLHGFTELSPQVTQKAFEQFSARTLAAYPGIRALEWIPRVPSSGRAKFEAQMKAEGSLRPEITDGSPRDDLKRAADRAEYYPVQYIYPPTESTRRAVGVDLSQLSSFQKAMELSRETRQARAADRFRLLEKTADGYGVPILLPVFRPGSGAANKEDGEFTGFVMGIIQVSDILERALKYVDQRGIDIQVFDDSAPEGRRMLFVHHSRLARGAEPATPEQGLSQANTLISSSSIDVAGHKWRIVCTPAQEFLQTGTTSTPWVVLVAGLLVTLAMGIYLALQLRNNSRKIRLTQQLSQANERLNAEIAERIRTEENLSVARDRAIESSRLKSHFLANVGHRLRTPINGIVGVHGLLLNTPLSAQQREYVETVERSGKGLIALINDILDFSRLETGKLDIERISFNVTEMLGQLLEPYARLAAVKKTLLTCRTSPDLPELVRGDPMRMGQILSNLIANAIRFTETGEVSLSVSVEEQSGEGVVLRFEVKDTGTGISSEDQKNLFQPLAHADGPLRLERNGLGLAISKQLVELMHGSLGFESTAGRGSTFWFTLRVETPQVQASSI